jgi:hypothetical protein
VDGGYISWTYGCREGTQDEWETARAWYSRRNGHVILLDHSFSYRQELDEHYKSRRQERREADPEKLATRARVHEFVQNTIKTDSLLTCLEWPGLEADDLVALAAMTRKSSGPINVVGVDKDLLQLPMHFLKLRKINDERVTIDNFVRRLPQAIKPYVRRGRDLLLCLVLLGDKSDSVVRLLPPRDFKPLIQLLHEPRPFGLACQWFGDFEVKRNTYLTVLPGPWVFQPTPSPDDVVRMLDDGSWWVRSDLWVDLPILEALHKLWG